VSEPLSGPERVLRVGGIDYLNSRPLLEGLPEALGPSLALENHVPSELARRLRSGELDAALIPVAEYFAGPDDYRIVPGISISSYGPVESIRFFHRQPLDRLGSVALDSSSLSSSALLRLLVRDRWSPPSASLPSFHSASPEEALAILASPAPSDGGVLLIGDSALAVQAAPGWEAVDLGTEWTRWTGLPFVYAFWVHRGPVPRGLAAGFQRARDIGRARVDAIVERGPLPAGMAPEEARRYLHRVIQYDLGPAEIEGLLLFRDRAGARGLLPVKGSGDLRFLPLREESR
jgi:chorismate dehydratase